MIDYVIASLPRVGSNLLKLLLHDSKKMGNPDEFFNGTLKDVFCSNGVDNDSEGFVRILRSTRTSINGVFGVVVQPEHKNAFCFIDPARCKFIYMTRENKLKQAISHLIAKQTQAWVSLDKPKTAAVYDFKALQRELAVIKHWESVWQDFFREEYITPLCITYEELIKDPKSICEKVCSFVGVSIEFPVIDINTTIIKKQSTNQNYMWERQYNAHRSNSNI